FGTLGDLAKRNLIPALFHLAREGCLSSRFKVLGVAREPLCDEGYRERMREGATGAKDMGEFSHARWLAFAGCLHYLSGDLSDPEIYIRLAARLDQMTRQEGVSSNHLFYLSTPPSLLHAHGQTAGAQCDGDRRAF